MKQNIFLIFDIDATLTRSDNKLSEYTIETLKKLDKIYHIWFCTGRNLQKFNEVMPQNIGEILIGSDGTFIYDLNSAELINSNIINKNDLDVILNQKCLRDICLSTVNDFIRYEKNKKLADIIKLDFNVKENQNIDNVTTYLKGKLNFSNIYKMRDSHSESEWLVVTPKESSKKQALISIVKKVNIKKENLYYFGDSFTDIQPMSVCAHKICPSNAIEQVKAICDTIVESNDSDGVAHYLNERFLSEDV